MAQFIPQSRTSFFLEWWQGDLFGFQSHVLTSWDECWRTCFEAWGYISLCKAFALSSLPHYPPQPVSHALPSCSDSLQCLLVILHDLYMKSLLFIHLRDSHCVSAALRRLYHFSDCVFSNLFIFSHAQTFTLRSFKPGSLWEPHGSEKDR